MKSTLYAAAAALMLALGTGASAADLHGLREVAKKAHALTFQYLPLPDSRYVPLNVVRSTDGSLWFDAQARVQCGHSQICELRQFGHVVNGQIATFTFPLKSGYQSLAAGPQGTAWIVAGTSLYVYTAAGVLANTYAITTTTGALSAPTLGPDGRMWLTDFSGRLIAVTADGQISSYTCANFPLNLVAGRDGKLWGTGLTSDYQPFFFSATTGGAVTEYAGGTEDIIAGPGARLAEISSFQIDTIDKHENLVPLASLQALGLDQTVALSASNSLLWFVGTRNDVQQAIVGTVSERGVVKSEPFGSVPCTETWVYFSGLVQGSDGAMYGGFGCGDVTGTHAGYLARIAQK